MVIGIVGACGWNYYSASKKAEEMVAYRDSVEKARQDSLAKAKQMEIARQDSILKTQQEEIGRPFEKRAGRPVRQYTTIGTT